ncbi:hypothetical protein DFQ30_010157, partial [Apophysomyces sp. BC1015]
PVTVRDRINWPQKAQEQQDNDADQGDQWIQENENEENLQGSIEESHDAVSMD